MTKMLFAALMAASALVPAAAFAQDDHHEQHAERDGRGQRGSEQPAASPQGQRQAEAQARQYGRQQPAPPATPAPQMRAQTPQGFGQPNSQAYRGQVDQAQVNRAQADRIQAARGHLYQGQAYQGQAVQGQAVQGRGRPDGQQGWQQPTAGAARQRDAQRGNVSRGDGQRGQGWRDQGEAGRDVGQQGAQAQANDRHRYDGQARDGIRGYGNRGDAARGHDGRGYEGRGSDAREGWNRDWRGDRRYDYRDYRNHDRAAFHLGRYYAPYGWSYGYRRFSIGIQLSPVLFGRNYWIDDVDLYQLPPAYGPYRWVRYYNDALLVDVYTGEVVDTVYDIFW